MDVYLRMSGQLYGGGHLIHGQQTLLLVYSNFTPLPVSVCLIVLYSPSSSSLTS